MFGEYLHANLNTLGLVTKVHTAEQKRYRAFSAELIAPANKLKVILGKDTKLCDDDILDIAEKFHTDGSVIKYQITNHRLAEVC